MVFATCMMKGASGVVVIEQHETSKEYLQGYITEWLRVDKAWRDGGPVDVVVRPAPGQSPNWTCEVSGDHPEGSPRAEALQRLLANLHERFRLREQPLD